MFGYGHFLQIGENAYVCALFQGIMMFGVLIGTIAGNAYGLDAYRDSSNEIFVMNMLLKNFLFFGISYVANNWVVNSGPFDVLAVCASTSMFAVCFLLCEVANLITDRSRASHLYLWEKVTELLDSSQFVGQVGSANSRRRRYGPLISAYVSEINCLDNLVIEHVYL
jgi:hypothetical protein